MLPGSFDVIGNIAILKFGRDVKKGEKVKVARELMSEHKNITTVVEKSDKIKGRLRNAKTDYLAGKNTKEAFYKENGCVFRFDIDETYFSPRLSNERNEVAKQVKKNESVLVLFAGVGPFSIVIAKMARPKEVYSVELNKKASKYAEKNVLLNKLSNVRVIQGDAKRVCDKLSKEKIKFDRVVMPRPQLKDSFLEEVLKVIKKDGMINYYGFSDSEDEILDTVMDEAKKAKKKIRIIKIKKAGDIGPYRFRWRVDLRVLNH